MTGKSERKLKNVAVWGFLLAGMLGLIGGLRDIFAPGFFKVSPALPSKAEIALQFLLAATFLALAALTNISKHQTPITKK